MRVAKGLPAQEGPYSVLACVEDYLAFLEANRKSAKDARWRAEALILPELGNIACADLNPVGLRKWLARAAAAAPRLRTRKGKDQQYRNIDPDDEEQRRRLGAVYRKASDEVAEIYAVRGKPAHLSDDQYRRLMAGGQYLWEHLAEAPVLLVPCLRTRDMPPRDALPEAVAKRYEAHLAYQAQIRGASIYPAVQNIILACRALGLGTLITTNHILYEDEIRSILSLPSDVFTFALMPIGYPLGKYGPLSRRPVSEVAYSDRWGEKWPE